MRAQPQRDLARHFNAPLPTVHHVLSTLVQEGLLAKDAARRYHMGPRIGALAASFMREQAVPSVWQRALAGLAASTGETAYLTAWRGGELRILAGVEGSRAVRVHDVHVGLYADAHARAWGSSSWPWRRHRSGMHTWPSSRCGS